MLAAVNILVVGDDPALLEMLTTVLSSPTWNVVSFPSSDEALRNIEGAPYSALLVDALPGYKSLISQFRKRNPQSPIVLCTGRVTPEAEKSALGAGANLVLLKPIAISVLRQHLQDLISVATQRAAAITVFDVELRGVMEIENRLITASLKGDVRELDELLSNEYVFAFGAMKETKRQRLQAVRSGRLRYRRIEPLHVEGKHYGDLCIVTGTVAISGERDGKDISGVYRSLHIFGRKQGKWKAVAGQLSPHNAREAIRA